MSNDKLITVFKNCLSETKNETTLLQLSLYSKIIDNIEIFNNGLEIFKTSLKKEINSKFCTSQDIDLSFIYLIGYYGIALTRAVIESERYKSDTQSARLLMFMFISKYILPKYEYINFSNISQLLIDISNNIDIYYDHFLKINTKTNFYSDLGFSIYSFESNPIAYSTVSIHGADKPYSSHGIVIHLELNYLKSKLERFTTDKNHPIISQMVSNLISYDIFNDYIIFMV